MLVSEGPRGAGGGGPSCSGFGGLGAGLSSVSAPGPGPDLVGTLYAALLVASGPGGLACRCYFFQQELSCAGARCRCVEGWPRGCSVAGGVGLQVWGGQRCRHRVGVWGVQAKDTAGGKGRGSRSVHWGLWVFVSAGRRWAAGQQIGWCRHWVGSGLFSEAVEMGWGELEWGELKIKLGNKIKLLAYRGLFVGKGCELELTSQGRVVMLSYTLSSIRCSLLYWVFAASFIGLIISGDGGGRQSGGQARPRRGGPRGCPQGHRGPGGRRWRTKDLRWLCGTSCSAPGERGGGRGLPHR